MNPRSLNRKLQWLTYAASAVAVLSLSNCNPNSSQVNAPIFASNTLGVNNVPPMCAANAPAGKLVNMGLGALALDIESVSNNPPFVVVTMYQPPTNTQSSLTGIKVPFFGTQALPFPNVININQITDVITFEVPAHFDYDIVLQYNEFGTSNPSITNNHTPCSNIVFFGKQMCRKFRSMRHMAANTIPLAGTSTDSPLTFPPVATADANCMHFDFSDI